MPVAQSVDPTLGVIGAISDRTKETTKRGPPTEYGEWVQNMHKALGNPNFVFTNIDKEHPLTPRLFMATDSSKPNDRNYEKLSSGLEISSYTTPSQYFFESLLNPVRVRLRQLQTEAARQRVIVYLNSRANMEYINKHYFLNRLQFLPIQVDKLRWNFLDDLVWNRNYLWLLPPQTKGLALLVCSHKQGTGRLSGIEAMTTVLTNGDQIISLWSPMLVDGSRTTMMLYGIG